MNVVIQSKLYIDYYNSQLEVWEPVIEPWDFQYKITKQPFPIKKTETSIFANKVCQINITKAMIETTLNTMEAIRNQDKEEIINSEERKIHPYLIRNETGIPMCYWFSNEESNIIDLEPGKEQPIFVPRNGLNAKNNRILFDESGPPNVDVQILGEFTPVKNLPIDKVGTYISRISPIDKYAYLTCDISFRKGSKVLTVKSNVEIINHTLHAIESIVLLEYQDSIILDPILPGHNIPIPLSFATTGILQIRPAMMEEYCWNQSEINLATLRRHRGDRKSVV